MYIHTYIYIYIYICPSAQAPAPQSGGRNCSPAPLSDVAMSGHYGQVVVVQVVIAKLCFSHFFAKAACLVGQCSRMRCAQSYVPLHTP